MKVERNLKKKFSKSRKKSLFEKKNKNFSEKSNVFGNDDCVFPPPDCIKKNPHVLLVIVKLDKPMRKAYRELTINSEMTSYLI